MDRVFLSLGSNLGDRIGLLKSAVELLEQKYGVVTKSPVYTSPPWGFKSKNEFLNMCVSFVSSESPQNVLQHCLDIEDGLGRERNKTVDGYTSRIIDIDILYFGVRLIEEANLHVPHHHLYRRKFVLLPLNDIAPDFIDPFRNKSVSILLNECEDSSLLILHSKI